jgi:hypothetical protein
MPKPLLQLDILPEQVAPLETLKGKQTHITLDYDEVQNIDQFISIYGDILTKFIKDNGVHKLGIEIKAHSSGLSVNKVVVILKAL